MAGLARRRWSQQTLAEMINVSRDLGGDLPAMADRTGRTTKECDLALWAQLGRAGSTAVYVLNDGRTAEEPVEAADARTPSPDLLPARWWREFEISGGRA